MICVDPFQTKIFHDSNFLTVLFAQNLGQVSTAKPDRAIFPSAPALSILSTYSALSAAAPQLPVPAPIY